MPYKLRTSSANVRRTWKWIFAVVSPGALAAGCVISILNSRSIVPATTVLGVAAYHVGYGLVFTLFISTWLGMAFGFSKWLKSGTWGFVVATAMWILSCTLLFAMDIIKFREGTYIGTPFKAQSFEKEPLPSWPEIRRDNDYKSLTNEQKEYIKGLPEEEKEYLKEEYQKLKGEREERW